MARRFSSRTNYQLKFITSGAGWRATPSLGPLFLRSPISASGSFALSNCRCHRLWATAPCWLLSFVFSSPIYPRIRSCGTWFAPVWPLCPPAWDLSAVLQFHNSCTFEPFRQPSLRNLTEKVLSLVSLATAKRVGELQAVSRMVSFVCFDACLSYVPEFVAKTESLSNPLCSFLVTSLLDFAAGLDDALLLCPVRALHIYIWAELPLFLLFLAVFLSPRRPS